MNVDFSMLRDLDRATLEENGAQFLTSKLDADDVDAALDYVLPCERRFRTAHVTADSAEAICELRSVTYTVEKTNYLSVAEVAIVAAQLTQVHTEYIVRSCAVDLPINHLTLARRRRSHEIVFANFYARCARPITSDHYRLGIQLTRTYLRKDHIFGHYEFTIEDGAHTGHFLAHTRPDD